MRRDKRGNLDVLIPTDHGDLHPVRNVSFEVELGKTLSIVGESGSGKSMTVLALMDLLPKNAQRSATELTFDGLDVMNPKKIKGIRGDRIGMIFQDPMTSLNPVYTVGTQLTEVYLRHRRANRAEARERALFLLEKVQIDNPPLRFEQYPHHLSGGIRQRVMIAMALMCD
ncbi:MAG: ABC transporter ATP-binding protein, partial [Rhodospirillales bacterium]|nr:ABC transporter ATP-binding protein [Rhodospirillales bacterium]